MTKVNISIEAQDLIYMAWILEDWARYQKGKPLWDKEAKEAEDMAKRLKKYADYAKNQNG